jgi:hypothetical protein
MRMSRLIALCVLLTGMAATATGAQRCDKPCLERIAASYRDAWLKHDQKLVPIAKRVRFVENNVEMVFPDGSWDTVSRETIEPLVLSDPVTGQVGIYTAVLQGTDTQTFVAIRLAVRNGQITEIEHVLSTKRNLSSPPTPIGDVLTFKRDPDFSKEVSVSQRATRRRLIAHANGYFDTLQFNNGEIRGTQFAPGATRNENGLAFNDIEAGFRSGRYRFNNRVRDRDCFLVDEVRSAVMCRGYIDHKGVLDEYKLTDGTPAKAAFREPQTWAFLESFKVKGDHITAVEATFTAAPYFIRSPFTKHPDPVYDALAGDR